METRMLGHIDQVSHCPICKETLSNPRIISCGHTFCQDCIDSMQIMGLPPTNRVLECPLCKKVTKVPKGGAGDFPINYMAIQVKTAVDEARETMKHTYCDACEQKTTMRVYCRNCQDKLCKSCEEKHLQVFADHVIVEDIGNVPTTRCSRHVTKLINVYCTECFMAICQLCATSNHAGGAHKVIPLQEAKENFVQQMKDKIDSLKKGRESLSGRQDELDSLRKETVDNYAFQKGLVTSAALKAVRKIKEEEKELLQQIEEKHTANIRRLDETEELAEKKITSLNSTLEKAETSVNEIQISDFPDKSLELLPILEAAERESRLDHDIPFIQKYTFHDAEGEATAGISLGSINLPPGESNTDLYLQKPYSIEERKEEEDQNQDQDQDDDVVQVERRVKEHANYMPAPMTLTVVDCTRPKEYLLTKLMLTGSFILESGVQNIPLNIIGVGLMQNHDVVCAYNTNRMGQVVLCTQPDKQQVLYHRRKGISAFALYSDEECSVVLEDDCNISRLVLAEIPTDREVTCMTHKISCKASNIGALAYNPDGVVVISDTDKNCLTGIDRQSKRPFNLNGNGNKNEETGSFSSIRSLACGPQGEIILYDGEKKRLAVFSSNTKFLHYINLPGLSSDCSVACDEVGVLFIADCKQNKVISLSLSGEEPATEILNGEDGLHWPTCITVLGRTLAVGNARNFSQGEVRVFEFVETYTTHV